MVMFQTWLKIDSVISIVLGTLLVIFPRHILPFIIVDKIDGIHCHMARVGGCVLLGEAFTFWRWSKATANYLGTAAMMTRLMGCLLCFGATVHARTFYLEHFIMISMRIWTTFLVITFLISALLILYMKWPIGEFLHEAKKQRVFNSLIQLDSIMAVAIGILFCAYPDRILYGQICIMVLSSQVYSQFAYPQSWAGKHWVGAGLFSVWAMTCFYSSAQQYRGVFR